MGKLNGAGRASPVAECRGEDHPHVNVGRTGLAMCAMISRPNFAWFNTSCIKVGPGNCVDIVVAASLQLLAVLLAYRISAQSRLTYCTGAANAVGAAVAPSICV